MALEYNYPFVRGDYDVQTLTVVGQDGLPVDLTGSTFKWELRKYYDDVAAMAAYSFTILNQTTNKGQVKFELSKADSEAIDLDASGSVQKFKETKYMYDVEWTPVALQPQTILRGIVSVIPEISQ